MGDQYGLRSMTFCVDKDGRYLKPNHTLNWSLITERDRMSGFCVFSGCFLLEGTKRHVGAEACELRKGVDYTQQE